MKKHLARFMATALSVAMVAATPLTVLAEPTTIDPTTEGYGVQEATGAILYHSVDTYVVPTTINLALNPQHYNVRTRHILVHEAQGQQDADVYLDTVDNSDIVSLNYGVANLSTSAKNLEITLEVDGWQADANGRSITFVGNDTGIDARTDYSMYLELVGGSNYKDNQGVHSGVVQDYSYTYSNGQAGYEAVNFTVADATNGQNAVDTAELAGKLYDVAINDYNESGVFMKNANGVVSAKNEYELYNAEYTPSTVIDFATTQDNLDNGVMRLNALGGIAAFSFTGAINESVDWTDLVEEELTFTPIYKFSDVSDDTPIAVAAEYVEPNYLIALPAGVAVTNIDQVENIKVNGLAVDATLNETNTGIVVYYGDVHSALGDATYFEAGPLTFTYTVGDRNYTATTANVSPFDLVVGYAAPNYLVALPVGVELDDIDDLEDLEVNGQALVADINEAGTVIVINRMNVYYALGGGTYYDTDVLTYTFSINNKDYTATTDNAF